MLNKCAFTKNTIFLLLKIPQKVFDLAIGSQQSMAGDIYSQCKNQCFVLAKKVFHKLMNKPRWNIETTPKKRPFQKNWSMQKKGSIEFYEK